MTANTPKNQPELPQDAPERRRLSRIPANGSLLFSSATEPMREGALRNRSASGVCIETSQPEQPGTQIDIEIKPVSDDPESETVFLSGRVTHVGAGEGIRSFMGVRLKDFLLGSGLHEGRATSSKGNLKPSRGGSDRIDNRTRRASDPSRDRPAIRAAKSTTVPESSNLKRYVLLFLLVFLLSVIGSDLTVNALTRHRPGPSLIVSALLPEAAHEKPARPSQRADMTDDDVLEILDVVEGQKLSLKATTGAKDHNAPSAALVQFDAEVTERSRSRSAASPDPLQKFMRTLEHARAADAGGDTGLALHLLRTGLATAGPIPAPWFENGERLQDALAKGDHSALASHLDQLVNFDPVTPNSGSKSESQVRVIVDVENYVLNIVVNGRVVRSFPVGLGLNGATPLGAFTIANKLTDPAWYNRGTVVPAGSPDNEIGHRWMGLGDSEGPTSYGIHPAQDHGSIGQPQSRGCVRMYPDDVETLFRIVPLGTPVEIH